jgi:hypothetical protein
MRACLLSRTRGNVCSRLCEDCYFRNRRPTSLTISSSSGNEPVASLEYTNSPSKDNSKHPPLEGTSVNPFSCCLYCDRILAAKLTALGS